MCELKTSTLYSQQFQSDWLREKIYDFLLTFETVFRMEPNISKVAPDPVMNMNSFMMKASSIIYVVVLYDPFASLT